MMFRPRLKLVYICVVFIFATHLAEGQRNISIGIRGGLNLSDIVLINYVDVFSEPQYQIKPGVHAGALLTFDVSDRVGLSSEILYSNKGVIATDKINLHYINIPLLTHYKLSERFYAEIGPEIGYLFSARSAYGNVSNTWNNKLDIGMVAGIHGKASKVVYGIRYGAGFSSVVSGIDESANNAQQTNEPIKYQNRTLQISLAFVLFEREYF